jgi:hypothetical protein
MTLLTEFLLRASFGLAVGMAITSARQVTSGYYRNHLYVTLGLTSLAALLSRAAAPDVFWWAVGAAVLSYVGSVCWLYEKPGAGKTALLLVALTSAAGLLAPMVVAVEEEPLATQAAIPADHLALAMHTVAKLSSGLLLGLTLATMLLGHWYLNSPTMELVPLRRLLLALGAAVVLQAIVSGMGLALELHYAASLRPSWWLFVALRWAFGLLGVAVLTWMAWQTIKIPNTQSATGILYVAVIGTFVGETMALLLSVESHFPL